MLEEVLKMPKELLANPLFGETSFSIEESDGDDELVTIENIDSPIIDAFQIQEIIRPDINIAKWAGVLFASPWSKNLTNSKKFTWKAVVEDEPVEAFLLIRPVNGQKRPTTTTYKHLLGMVQLWEKRGRPEDGVIEFSAREYCEVMEKKWQGSGTAKTIKEQLDIMRYSAITWAYSFSSKKNEYDSYHSGMTLLSDHTYLERKYAKKSNRFDSLHRAKIDARMINNMLTGNTKPVNYRTLISIKNGSAEAVYTIVDIILSSGKNKWERKLRNLFIDDLSLGDRYEKKGHRLSKAKEIHPYLDNKNLSNGGVLKVSIEETVDGTDYKLVCTHKKSIKHIHKNRKINLNKEEIEATSDEIIINIESIGSIDKRSAHKTIKNLLHYYDKNMLLLCASRLKVEYKGIVKQSVIKTFMYVVHCEAHNRGLEWIKDCGKDCTYRPENKVEKLSVIDEPKETKKTESKKPKSAKNPDKELVNINNFIKHKGFDTKNSKKPKMTQAEADGRVKDEFLASLSPSGRGENLEKAKKLQPEIEHLIIDFSKGGVGYGLLRYLIPDFENKVEALM